MSKTPLAVRVEESHPLVLLGVIFGCLAVIAWLGMRSMQPLDPEQVESISVGWGKSQGLLVEGTQCHDYERRDQLYCELTVRNTKDGSLQVYPLACTREKCWTVPRLVEK